MRISAKADYAVRALVELAAAEGDKPVKAERIATAQEIPLNFLENILGELRHTGIVRSHRGAEGGFRLAKPPSEITVADVIRAVEGPLASVRGAPPEEASYAGAASSLPRVWIAVRANLRRVVEQVTIADIAADKLPVRITKLTEDPGAWVTR
jgi:Rrf2 family protein